MDTEAGFPFDGQVSTDGQRAAIAWKARTGDSRIASHRYRVLFPIKSLSARGHDVELYRRERFADYTTIVFSKSYSADDLELATRFRDAGKAVVLDLCDNHFYNPMGLQQYESARQRLIAMLGLVDRVICSTSALAKVVRAEAGLSFEPVVVGDIVESVPLDARPRRTEDPRRLLWFGSHGSPNAPSGMTDLVLVTGHLTAAHQRWPFELVVTSNNREKFERKVAPRLSVPIRYVEWSEDLFPGLLAATDAVILPLSNNPFVNCKSHNRLTLALAAGVPVVADEIDSYREFSPYCHIADWEAGLAAVLGDPEGARARAALAGPYLAAHWSRAAIVSLWERALGLADGSSPGDAKVATRAKTGAPDRGHIVPVAGGKTSGRIRMPNPGRFDGWAFDPAKPHRRIVVDLAVDDVVVATALACEHRPDLARDGFGDGCHGYSIPIPVALCDGREHMVELRDRRTGLKLSYFNQPPVRLSGTPENFGISRARMEQVAAVAQQSLDNGRADLAALLLRALDPVPDASSPYKVLRLRLRVAARLDHHRTMCLIALRAIRAYGPEGQLLNELFKGFSMLDRRDLAEAVLRRAARHYATGRLSWTTMLACYRAARQVHKADRHLRTVRVAANQRKDVVIQRTKLLFSIHRYRDAFILMEEMEALGVDVDSARASSDFAENLSAFQGFATSIGLRFSTTEGCGDFRVDGLRALLDLPTAPVVPGRAGAVILCNELGIGGTQRQIVGAVRALQAGTRWAEPIKLLCRSLSRMQRHDHYLRAVQEQGLEPELLDTVADPATLPPTAAMDLLRGLRGRLRDALQTDDVLAATAALWAAKPRVAHIRQNWGTYATAAILAGVPRILIHIGLVPERDNAMASEAASADLAATRGTLRLLGRHPAVEFVLNSRAGADEYAAWLDLPCSKLRLLHNVFEPSDFPVPSMSRRAYWRQRLRVPDGAFVVGFVGRLSAQKDPLLWLDICTEVARCLPKAWFLMVGDGVMRDEIEHRIALRGLADRVRIHGTAQDGLADLYGIMDVLLLTSRREGLPNAVLEAQWLGVPVVAKDVAGVREAVLDGRTGFVVGSAARDDYVSRILAIQSDPDWVRECRAQAPAFVRKGFGVTDFAEGLLQLYGCRSQDHTVSSPTETL